MAAAAMVWRGSQTAASLAPWGERGVAIRFRTPRRGAPVPRCRPWGLSHSPLSLPAPGPSNSTSMSLGTAKHEAGTTLGSHPDLYPYVMDHIGEIPEQVELRDQIVQHDRSIMMGAPDEAQFLGWLAATMNAKKVIEVGVFRGSTTLAIALALPDDAKIVGLDVSEEFAQLGKAAWKKCGVDHKIDFRLGAATDSLDAMIDAGEEGSYDLAFIDADKTGYDSYYERCLKLLRPGGVIAIDNVLWSGLVNKPIAEGDDSTEALVAIAAKVRSDPRVKAVMLPIADGCYMARKL